MSRTDLASVLSCSTRCHRAVTLLPFLYYTETLAHSQLRARSFTTSASCNRLSTDRFTTVATRRNTRNPTRSEKQPQGQSAPLDRPKGPKGSDPSPGRYQVPATSAAYKTDVNLSSSTTTLTRRERGIFEDIFRDVLQNINYSGASQALSPSDFDQVRATDEEESFSEDDSLESIFATAIATRNHPAQALNAAVEVKDHGKALETQASSTLAAAAESTADEADYQSETARKNITDMISEQQQSILLARSSDTSRFQASIEGAVSDRDIWNVFEKDVLKKMENFVELVVKHSQSPEKAGEATSMGKKDRKGKMANEPVMSPVSVSPWQHKPEIVQILSVLRSNYAHQCVLCLQTLRGRYPRSPYVLSFLPKIKSLGAISYALAASTELYNELIFVRWMYYRDLHGCAELVDEMLERSVPTDAKTRAVFADAKRSRMQGQAFWKAAKTPPAANGLEDDATFLGTVSPASSTSERSTTSFTAAWWHLQGTQSGWEKWQAAEERAVSEVRAAQQRRAEDIARARVADEDDTDEDESVQIEEPDIELVKNTHDQSERQDLNDELVKIGT